MGMDLSVQTLNLILLTYYNIHFLCTIMAQSFPWEFVEEKANISKQNIIFKPERGGDVRGVNGAKMFASLFPR